MKVHVDFSVYTDEDGSFGGVSGEIEVITLPQIGDSVSFMFSSKGIVIDPEVGFRGMLDVTSRIILANHEDQKLMLTLSDVVVKTRADALQLVKYFEDAFGLFADIYE